jgi:hypothetical protein
VPVYGDLTMTGYEIMNRILNDPERKETAWLCVTAPPAMGAMRAMLDKGLQPGKDIAICTVNGEGLAQVLNPRLTSLEAADPQPYLSVCIKWMMAGGGHWQGPLLMRPSNVPLYVRASTDPQVERELIQ